MGKITGGRVAKLKSLKLGDNHKTMQMPSSSLVPSFQHKGITRREVRIPSKELSTESNHAPMPKFGLGLKKVKDMAIIKRKSKHHHRTTRKKSAVYFILQLIGEKSLTRKLISHLEGRNIRRPRAQRGRGRSGAFIHPRPYLTLSLIHIPSPRD